MFCQQRQGTRLTTKSRYAPAAVAKDEQDLTSLTSGVHPSFLMLHQAAFGRASLDYAEKLQVDANLPEISFVSATSGPHSGTPMCNLDNPSF